MPKRTNDFQKLVYLAQTNLSDGSEVIESKLLKDRVTKRYREVDVVIRGSIGTHQVLVSIECRDHKRAADVTWVDAMKSKHERLPTNALLLASSSGFTKEARRVAESHGIGVFEIEDQEPEEVGRLLGPDGALWSKNFVLTPEKVRVHVEETAGLPEETVAVSPDNLLYSENGEELGQLNELVDSLVNAEFVRDHIGREGTEEHRWFVINWGKPETPQQYPLFMKKLDPLVLRKVAWIDIKGQCKIEIVRFGLRYGRIGRVRMAWGKAVVAGNETLAVATKGDNQETKLSIAVVGNAGKSSQA